MAKKFEYKVVDTSGTSMWGHQLNEYGQDGWELVCVTTWVQGLSDGTTAYFKKEVDK